MIRFTKIWCWVVVVAVVILAAGVTILFAQTNDASISEEVNSPSDTNKINPSTEVGPKPESPSSPSVPGNVDPATKVEVQRLFNELRSEYLDTRAESINWWLVFITIVLAFFAVVIPIAIAIISYIGRNRFRELESDASRYVEEARQLVKEIEGHRAQSEAHLREITSEDIGDPDKAREVEEAILGIQSDPDRSLIDSVIADIYTLQREDRIGDAIEKWRSIANITQGTDIDFAARSWFSIGYLHLEEDKKEDALLAYNKAIRLKPDLAEAYINRGIVKSELGQYEAAVEDYNEAIRLKPDLAEVYTSRGIAKSELGQYEAAIEDCNEAIRLKPDLANAYTSRGFAKLELGQYEAAIEDCNEAIRLKPDLAEAYNNIGFARTKLGQHELAIEDCNEAIRLKPDLANAYDSRGIAKRSLGQHASAIEDYNEAIRLDPNDAEFYYNRGNVHVDLGNIEGAKQDFQIALDRVKRPREADLKTNIEQRLRELNGTE